MRANVLSHSSTVQMRHVLATEKSIFAFLFGEGGSDLERQAG
jgi:hypothetical protein